MKFKLWIVLTGWLILSAACLKAQKNVVKVNALSALVRTVNIQYEHVINTSSSFQIGLFYTWNNRTSIAIWPVTSDEATFSGFGITPEYRFYLSETESPQGNYIAPFFRYVSLNVNIKKLDQQSMRLERQVDFNSFGGGVIIGRQWTFKKRIDLDVFVGPAYYMGITDEQPGTEDFKMKQFNDFEVRAGICLGVRF